MKSSSTCWASSSPAALRAMLGLEPLALIDRIDAAR
jgi:hypothetical protein